MERLDENQIKAIQGGASLRRLKAHYSQNGHKLSEEQEMRGLRVLAELDAMSEEQRETLVKALRIIQGNQNQWVSEPTAALVRILEI